MAAFEMYDFLPTVTPDYNAAIGISPQGEVSEESSRGNQVIHIGADGSEERIAFGTVPTFFILFAWKILTEANSGTIFDWYNDATKANGTQRSFKYAHGDGHTYVVRFDCKLTRSGKAVWSYGIPSVRMKVLGRIAD